MRPKISTASNVSHFPPYRQSENTVERGVQPGFAAQIPGCSPSKRPLLRERNKSAHPHGVPALPAHRVADS